MTDFQTGVEMLVSSGLFLTYAKVLDPAMAWPSLKFSNMQWTQFCGALEVASASLCSPSRNPEPRATALLTVSQHVER